MAVCAAWAVESRLLVMKDRPLLRASRYARTGHRLLGALEKVEQLRGPLLWLAFLQQHDVGIIFGMQHGKHFAIWRPAENVDRPRSKIRNLMS